VRSSDHSLVGDFPIKRPALPQVGPALKVPSCPTMT